MNGLTDCYILYLSPNKPSKMFHQLKYFKLCLLQLIIICFFIILTLNARSAGAQSLTHRVRPGETLEDIARHYYGTEKVAHVLRLANSLGEAEQPDPGRDLSIPTGRLHTVEKTTTLKELAATLLEDGRRQRALEVDGRAGPGGRLRPGQHLWVPFVFRHRPTEGETWAEISRRYYRTPKHGRFLGEFNGRPKSMAPVAGSEVLVPMGRLRVRPGLLQALVEARLLGMGSPAGSVASTGGPGEGKPPASAEPGAGPDLRPAQALLRTGEYEALPLELVAQLGKGRSLEDQVQALLLLAWAYAALDRPVLVETCFRRLLRLRPGFRPDPVETSPRLLEAFQRALANKK